jgi:hypothetical protein
MAEMREPIEVPFRIVIAETDDGAARQREMAEHVRFTGEAWLALADRLEAFADYLDTLPVASNGAHLDTESEAGR